MKELSGEEIKVTANFSRKIQPKPYEPIDVTCVLTEICQKGQEKETYDKLFQQCVEYVYEKLERQRDLIINGDRRVSEKQESLFEPSDHLQESMEEEIDIVGE